MSWTSTESVEQRTASTRLVYEELIIHPVTVKDAEAKHLDPLQLRKNCWHSAARFELKAFSESASREDYVRKLKKKVRSLQRRDGGKGKKRSSEADLHPTEEKKRKLSQEPVQERKRDSPRSSTRETSRPQTATLSRIPTDTDPSVADSYWRQHAQLKRKCLKPIIALCREMQQQQVHLQATDPAETEAIAHRLTTLAKVQRFLERDRATSKAMRTSDLAKVGKYIMAQFRERREKKKKAEQEKLLVPISSPRQQSQAALPLQPISKQEPQAEQPAPTQEQPQQHLQEPKKAQDQEAPIYSPHNVPKQLEVKCPMEALVASVASGTNQKKLAEVRPQLAELVNGFDTQEGGLHVDTAAAASFSVPTVKKETSTPKKVTLTPKGTVMI